ncbi:MULTISPECIES: hypothetical protein [unclassified Nocardiopsis]|uniref:hypothetical protein n=1 Tax=unclassified Nocardiopsis TaxID=2649073 RepID=UPI00066C30E2|nr:MULTISPECIES: hypothetical protein [unclassified Nocardiopsis]MBQ1080835.1 hypothetical protein [Nocardiopsis sp. B62]
MTESAEFDRDATDVDDVDAEMDAGAPDQDSAVAEYLEDHSDDHRIDEIEDHGVLGVDAEVGQEVPDGESAPEEDGSTEPRREDLSRILRAEQYAERVNRRLEG